VIDFCQYAAALGAWQQTMSRGADYARISARGASSFDLRLRQGAMVSAHETYGIAASVLLAQKKGKKWQGAERFYFDLDCLNDWSETRRVLVQAARDISDPRAPYQPPGEEVSPSSNRFCDSEVARALSALVFHRAYRLLREAIVAGLGVDAHIAWRHGGRCWSGAGLPFAYVDNNVLDFGPKSWIDERVTIFLPDKPYLRRHLAQTSTGLETNLGLLASPLETLLSVQNTPLMATSARNIERVIFAPQAVASILATILPAFSEDEINRAQAVRCLPKAILSGSMPLMSPDWRLACDATHPLFARDGACDARGQHTQIVEFLKEGAIVRRAASDVVANSRRVPATGHALDPSGRTSVFYPVLAAKTHTDAPWHQALSQSPARTLVIEAMDVILPEDSTQPAILMLPSGGVLYANGRCQGHTQGALLKLSPAELLAAAKPLGTATRIEGIVTCAIELEPNIIVDAFPKAKS